MPLTNRNDQSDDFEINTYQGRGRKWGRGDNVTTPPPPLAQKTSIFPNPLAQNLSHATLELKKFCTVGLEYFFIFFFYYF